MPTPDASNEFVPTHRMTVEIGGWSAGTPVVIDRDDTATDGTVLIRRANGDAIWRDTHYVEPLPRPGAAHDGAAMVSTTTPLVGDWKPTHVVDTDVLGPELLRGALVMKAEHDRITSPVYRDRDGVEWVIADQSLRRLAEPVAMAGPAPEFPRVVVRVEHRAQLSGDGNLTAGLLQHALGQLPISDEQEITVETIQPGTRWRVDVTWVTTEETGK